MVVADEHALACIFSANDVTRDGVRHDSRIRESKIFRDHAAPAIGPKFDSSHGWPGKYTRSDISAEHPDWPAYQATLISSHFMRTAGKHQAGTTRASLVFVPPAISRFFQHPARGREDRLTVRRVLPPRPDRERR